MADSIPIPPVDPVLAYRDPVAALREKMTLWAGRKLKTEEVVYIMKTISREILEGESLQEKCPMARTFGHLCLHHRLDRASAGGRALVDVAEAAPIHDATDPGRDNDWLTDFANYELSFHRLRLELLAVCRRFGLPDQLFLSWDGWRRFFMPLAEEISGRVMTADDLPPLRKKLHDAPLEGGRTLENVRLLIAVNWPEVPYWWSFEASDRTKIVIPVRFGERELKDGPTPAGWVSPLA